MCNLEQCAAWRSVMILLLASGFALSPKAFGQPQLTCPKRPTRPPTSFDAR
jgi:hypothetical protein